MMQKALTARRLILQLVLSFLLIFTLLGTVIGGIGTYVAYSPSLLLTQLEKQDAAQKVHDSLETTFETQYNTTAVSAEVYMDVLTVDWLESAMIDWTENYYTALRDTSADTSAISPDYTALEDSITAYFETFAAENDYEKDDAYTEKLEEIITDAESTVNSAIDVYHFSTMQNAGIFSTLQDFLPILPILTIGCGLLSVVWILWLLLLRQQPCYWIGTSLFADGILCMIPTGIVLATSVIQQFSLKDPAVYAVFTGTMTALTQLVLGLGIALLCIGLLLWIGSLIHTKKQAQPIQTKDETKDEHEKQEGIL